MCSAVIVHTAALRISELLCDIQREGKNTQLPRGWFKLNLYMDTQDRMWPIQVSSSALITKHLQWLCCSQYVYKNINITGIYL